MKKAVEQPLHICHLHCGRTYRLHSDCIWHGIKTIKILNCIKNMWRWKLGKYSSVCLTSEVGCLVRCAGAQLSWGQISPNGHQETTYHEAGLQHTTTLLQHTTQHNTTTHTTILLQHTTTHNQTATTHNSTQPDCYTTHNTTHKQTATIHNQTATTHNKTATTHSYTQQDCYNTQQACYNTQHDWDGLYVRLNTIL